jgi:hypothetical protein
MAAQSVGEGIEKFALHVAVWDDDADRLQDLLVAGRHGEMRSSDRYGFTPESAGAFEVSLVSSFPCADLELRDARDNTPLMLAYRMGRTKIARMLLAGGAFPKPRTAEGFEAVQVAALTANPDIIREAVLAFLAETDAAFERRVPGLQAALVPRQVGEPAVQVVQPRREAPQQMSQLFAVTGRRMLLPGRPHHSS